MNTTDDEKLNLNSSRKKVAIIGTNGLPAAYGGFETLANYLTLHHGESFELFVFCPKTPIENRKKLINGAHMIYLPFLANGAQSILYDIVSIIIAVFRFNTLIILGTPGCLIIPFVRLKKGLKIIINFGGLEWKRNKWPAPARWYLKLTEAIAVRNADTLVVDNQAFADYVNNEYGRQCELIEYGADHVQTVLPDKSLIKEYQFLSHDYFVSVSRAQPDNNLHIVCEAFVGIDEKLVIISNWSANSYGVSLKENYSKYPNITLLDAIYDIRKLNAIRSNSKCYIHSHSFCGTAPSLVEAMMLGLPVISFAVETNIFTTENKAEFFTSVSDLRAKVLSFNNERAQVIGEQMREIAKQRYIWRSIVDRYESLY